VAHAARVVDERGIDGLIRALVGGVSGLGGRARTLQTGLVSRELVVTLGGVALVVAVLLVIR
jgi:NADH-quinone oxidoreductase subunit L